MELEFVKARKAILSFSVGSSLVTAKSGPSESSPEGKKITVPYPQSVYVTLFNTGFSGELLISYKYIDQAPEDAEDFKGELFYIEDTTSK